MTHPVQIMAPTDISFPRAVAPSRPSSRFIWISLIAIVALGLALRVAASRAQIPIVDEGFTLLAGQVVAERGIPLLPSGILYLHGTTLSYLLAPLMALGLDAPGHLVALRLISALAGTIAIALTYALARTAVVPPAAALFAAALVAVDPASVLWGGYVRMYALSQPLALAVALLFLLAIAGEPNSAVRWSRRRDLVLGGLVICFWLAVYTHLATALLWPAMTAAALVIYGTELVGCRRDLTLALAACALAPLTLVVLTGAIGPGAGTTIASRAEGLPGVSFLGEDNVNLAQVLHPDPSPWTALFAGGPLGLLAPLLLALASGVVIGRTFLASPASESRDARRAAGALLALYWAPILLLALFATDAAERYAIYLLPIGYVLLALAASALVASVPVGRRSGWAVAGAVVLAGAFLLHNVAGTAGLDLTRAQAAQQTTAEAFVAANREPGELILTSASVDTALALGRLPELRYLPGGEESQRALRYTHTGSDGQAIDYWLGIPSLATTDALCATLQDAPGSWLLLGDRVWENWGYNDLSPRHMERRAGAMQALVLGLAEQVYENGDTIVLRSRPVEAWGEEALAACKHVVAPHREHRQKRRAPDASLAP